MHLIVPSFCVFPPDEVMNSVDENPEEAMLRKFFQGKAGHGHLRLCLVTSYKEITKSAERASF